MTSQFWNPNEYNDPEAQLASGVTFPPMTRPIGFVTQSPGDLFLASKGLTSQTKALITRLGSATEIQTSLNEVVNVRGYNTDTGVIAIDVGESSTPDSRDLLVYGGTGSFSITQGVASFELGSTLENYYKTPVAVGSPRTGSISAATKANILAGTSKPAATVENASPSSPSQYIAPSNSYVAPSTTVSTPAPANQWVSAGAFIVDDYAAYLVSVN